MGVVVVWWRDARGLVFSKARSGTGRRAAPLLVCEPGFGEILARPARPTISSGLSQYLPICLGRSHLDWRTFQPLTGTICVTLAPKVPTPHQTNTSCLLAIVILA